MLPKSLFSEPQKVRPFLFVSLILALTFLAFFLDIATRDLIAFDIFYFPSIMLVTWYLGDRPGRLMVILTALLWFFAQMDARVSTGVLTLLLDGVVHFFTFGLVFWMTGWIHKSAVLMEAKSKELARSNLELEQFAYKAAHDLQSPLSTIYSYSEFLAEENEKYPADEKLILCAEAILKGAKRMSLMIKALLDYAKVGQGENKNPPVGLSKIAADAVENLSAAIAEKKAEVTLDPLPAVAIHPGLAGILFQNLIGNALKYCEQPPRVRVAAVRKGKDWVFSVQDNGIGIPEESRERIFIMFEKLVTRQKYPGSGIGLATCQKIVERYGGRIWVESKPGEGSTFFFTLPAA